MSTAQAQTAPRRAPARKRATAARAAGGSAATAAPERAVVHSLIAAEEAVRRNSVRLRVPIIGELRLPPAEQIAFLGGVAALAALEILEWPVAILLGVGHELAMNRHNKMMRAFGEALEEA